MVGLIRFYGQVYNTMSGALIDNHARCVVPWWQPPLL